VGTPPDAFAPGRFAHPTTFKDFVKLMAGNSEQPGDLSRHAPVLEPNV
jgi:hypothetical protein